jgi:60 kDa SS-A/Ro ribonucleoprotein
MNINTLARHGVFAKDADPGFIGEIAGRLSDADEIARSRQFPYQFLAAFRALDGSVPRMISSALELGADLACGNVPHLPGPVLVGLDVSGSMHSPVTGGRGRGATSAVRCVDAAALFAAAVLRRNPESVIVPFDESIHLMEFSSDEKVLTLATKLAKLGGGGTNCALPLAHANQKLAKKRFVAAILISDNQSWIGPSQYGSTQVVEEWHAFVRNQNKLGRKKWGPPKLVCLDMAPYANTQAPESTDVLNVGGFSDAVFDVIASFLGGDADHFVREVEAIEM